MMRTCKTCGRTLDESEFSFHYANKGNLRWDCKACHDAKTREWQAKNRQRLNARSDERRKAHLYEYAVRAKWNRYKRKNGIVPPSSCEECGKEGYVIAHHDDYERPYDIRWLCMNCDRAAHRSQLVELV